MTETESNNLTPAEVFPPGEYLRDELESRGWTQQDLADILRRPLNAINQIIVGKRGITTETAVGLAAAFGTSAELWLNLENSYQLWQARHEVSDVAKRARLFSIAPVNDMIRRSWIESSENVDVIESQLKAFFQTDNLDAIPSLRVAARKSTSYDETSTEELVWHHRVRNLARSINVRSFDASMFPRRLAELRNMTPFPENIRLIPALFAEWGIRFVVVEALQKKTRLDGAAFWLNNSSPVIAVSLRFDRIDSFWFTLIHECVHIKNGDNVPFDIDVATDAKGDNASLPISELEQKTNAEAANLLVPAAKIESFIVRQRPMYFKTKIIQFAQANNVHPGIVVGQLQRRKEIMYSHSREMLVAVKDLLIPSALTDGWNNVAGAF